ncbi:MAG: PAS domain S-box protein [Deltaproteobacteria bacterium]|nr:PAS domain S-box protein [Deltaproteobacteria bacterium]
MGNKLRKTGIEIIGDVPWGAHFSQFYQSKQDLIDILVPYFKTGLENNEYCIWITSEPLTTDDALAAMRAAIPDFDIFLSNGQIEILPYNEWYYKADGFNAQRVLNGWLERYDKAVSRGFDGMRLTGNTFWLQKRDWVSFKDYEKEVDEKLGSYRIIALCTYPVDRCSAADLIDVISNHQLALIKKDGKWDFIEGSEHKFTEQDLRDKEKKYRFISELTSDFVFSLKINPEGLLNLEWITDGAFRISGYSFEEIDRQDKWKNIIHPEDYNGLMEFISDVFEGGSGNFEFRLRTKDGALIWLGVQLMPEWDEACQVIGITGAGKEITGRRKAEAGLLESERKFRGLYESIKDGLVQTDMKGRILDCNQAYQDMLGYTKEEIKKLTYIDITPEKWHEPEEKIVAKIISNGYSNVYEKEYIRKDGSIFPISIRVWLVRGEKDEPAGMWGIIRDITERRQAQQELLRSRASLSEAQRIARLGNWDWDLVNKNLYWSDEIYRIFNISPDDFSSNYEALVNSIHPDDLEAVERSVYEAIYDGKPYNVEHRIILPDGAERYIHEKAEVIYDEAGKPVRMVGTIQDVTEHKQLEEELRIARNSLEKRVLERTAALQESNRKLQEEFVKRQKISDELIIQSRRLEAFFRHTITPLAFLDRNFNFIMVSDSYANSAGREPSFFIGRNHFELYPSEDNENIFRSVVERKKPFFAIGKPFIYPDHPEWGEIYWDWTLVPILDSNGEVEFLVYSLKDVTERKKAEKALGENLELLQGIMDNSRAIIHVRDTEGRYIMVNRRFEAVTCLRREHIIGLTHFDIFPKEAAEKLVSSDKTVIETGMPIEFENSMHLGDGPRTFITSKFPIFDSAGMLKAVCAISTDITERKLTEEALRQSEERFRSLVETSSDWVWEVDHNAIYTYASPKVKDVLGYEPQEIIGKSPFDFMPDQESKRVLKIFSEIEAEKKPFDLLENINIHKDGREVVIETSGTPVFDKNGEFAGYRGIDRDITSRKLAMQERERIQAQLFQSRKMETIGNLAGGIAHDFNNLMVIIQLNSDLALKNLKKQTASFNYLEQISAAAERASNLTRQLLIFSRNQPTEVNIFNINDRITNLLKILNRLISENITIRTELEPSLSMISADKGNIEQLIMNMVINAKDAMPNGGTIVIRTENVDFEGSEAQRDIREGKYICLTIEDTGEGMDEEVFKRIFEPFFTTKGIGKGTGLGLAVVSNIVKENKGWVDVSSKPGEGSTFKVFLPVSSDAAPINKKKINIRKPEGGGERVLLIEDERMLRKSVALVLTKNGYKVFEAENAQEAAEIFHKESGMFDLIFSDMILKDKNGIELVEDLLVIKPDIRVILTSGYIDIDYQWPIIKEKQFLFLQKPYEIPDLLQIMKTAITVA